MIIIIKVKGLLFLIVFTLPLSLAACSQNASESEYTAAEISRQIIDSQQNLSHLEMLTMDDEGFSDFFYDYYALEVEILEDGVICFPDDGADAREIMVLHLKEGVDPSVVEEQLLQYIELRTASYRGYMPDQVLLLEQAEVEIRGLYVVLLVCDDPYEASNAFASCVG